MKKRTDTGQVATVPAIERDERATRRRLEALDHNSLLRSCSRAGGDNTPWADELESAQDAEAKTELLAAREILVERLRGLSRVQQKIREGTRDRCDACGDAIPSARLAAVPEAIRCVDCAAALEAHQGQFATRGFWLDDPILAAA